MSVQFGSSLWFQYSGCQEKPSVAHTAAKALTDKGIPALVYPAFDNIDVVLTPTPETDAYHQFQEIDTIETVLLDQAESLRSEFDAPESEIDGFSRKRALYNSRSKRQYFYTVTSFKRRHCAAWFDSKR